MWITCDKNKNKSPTRVQLSCEIYCIENVYKTLRNYTKISPVFTVNWKKHENLHKYKRLLNRFRFNDLIFAYLGLISVIICCIVNIGTPTSEWLVMNNSSYVVAQYSMSMSACVFKVTISRPAKSYLFYWEDRISDMSLAFWLHCCPLHSVRQTVMGLVHVRHSSLYPILYHSTRFFS